MKTQTLSDLRKAADDAAAAWGAGMAGWERGRVSGHDVGVLKRRMKAAENALRRASYAAERAKSA